jgi:hypothetical protein
VLVGFKVRVVPRVTSVVSAVGVGIVIVSVPPKTITVALDIEDKVPLDDWGKVDVSLKVIVVVGVLDV